MPRIPPSLLRRAHRVSPHAATLLPACRDLPSALNELRWIRQHVQRELTSDSEPAAAAEIEVATLCHRRGGGEPLQYVLGTQPFGNLELKCRPGVLIPRPEPEAYTTHLANLIGNHALLGRPLSPLRVLDFCTGTGCIALLLYSLLHHTVPNLHVQGLDISPHAVRLARENARLNLAQDLPSGPSSSPPQTLTFSRGDIYSDTLLESLAAAAAAEGEGGIPLGSGSVEQDCRRLDVLVCNPPYVSPWGFAHQTARSVRNHEPKLAQVPAVAYPGGHRPEDAFYARLLDVAVRLRPRVMLFEVGDLAQASRVVGLALRHEKLGLPGLVEEKKAEVEVWRDWPDAGPGEDEETVVRVDVGRGDCKVPVRGSGHGRSVFIRCA